MEVDDVGRAHISSGQGFLGVRMGKAHIQADALGMMDDMDIAGELESKNAAVAAPSVGMIACCNCGELTPANPTACCTACLQRKVDPTEHIEKHLTIPFCRHCHRYQRPPWLVCEWESKELLALCLKRIKGLQNRNNASRLVDAKFLYTEIHSKRIRVKLTLQQEVAGGAVLEKSCVVEFSIHYGQCDDCCRAFTPHTWTAVVQVRQRAAHKRSLMYLEQVILSEGALQKVIKAVDAPPDGIDFQFSSKSAADDFVAFCRSVLPIRTKTSKQLISHDPKSNTAFHKFAITLEVCPVCKDDLVYLPPKLANSLYGGISPFLLVTRVTTVISIVDPFTLRAFEVPAEKYWKDPFESVLTRRFMTKFIVLNVEPVSLGTINTAAHAKRHVFGKNKREKAAGRSVYEPSLFSSKRPQQQDPAPEQTAMDMLIQQRAGKLGAPDPSTCIEQATSVYERNSAMLKNLADIEVARVSDFGLNDTRFIVRSHLGGVVRPGDWCLGYDLTTCNSNFPDDLAISDKIISDIVLVRKTTKRKPDAKTRNWVLRRMPVELGGGNADKRRMDVELEEFKQDLEEDRELRNRVQLFKRKDHVAPAENAFLEDDADSEQEDEAIRVCELLDNLNLEDDTAIFE